MNSSTLQTSLAAFIETAAVDFRANQNITCFNPAKLRKAHMRYVSAFNHLLWMRLEMAPFVNKGANRSPQKTKVRSSFLEWLRQNITGYVQQKEAWSVPSKLASITTTPGYRLFYGELTITILLNTRDLRSWCARQPQSRC